METAQDIPAQQQQEIVVTTEELIRLQQLQQQIDEQQQEENGSNGSSVLPSGCLPVDPSMPKEELVVRLQKLAKRLQETPQENEEKFRPLATSLASHAYFVHASSDVRLLVALIVAELFRINAPEAPFEGDALLREIFAFLTKQLEGIRDPNGRHFNRHYYLLENLAWVKPFNICLDLPAEINQPIFVDLFRLIFSVVIDDQTPKVRVLMMDMLWPLILEADEVSTELVAIPLSHLLPTVKSNRRVAYGLAKVLVEKCAEQMAPPFVRLASRVLHGGEAAPPFTREESLIASRFFDVVLELHQIAPELLIPVLPHFETRLLRSKPNKERLEMTQLLCRLFNSRATALFQRVPGTWAALLRQFSDPHVPVRSACIQMTSHIFLNHPERVADVVEPLKECGRNSDESVRFHVVQAILNSAKKSFASVPDEAIEIVSERVFDKRFKIRKESVTGLAVIYNQIANSNSSSSALLSRVTWIPGKVMQYYFLKTIEDKLLAESVMVNHLVPKHLDAEAKSIKLYELYVNLSEAGQISFRNYLSMQGILRSLVGQLEQCACDSSVQGGVASKEEEANRLMIRIARYLPNPVRAKNHLARFYSLLRDEFAARKSLLMMLSSDAAHQRAAEGSAALLKKCGSPTATNLFYQCMRNLFTRLFPVYIDRVTIDCLLRHVSAQLANEDANESSVSAGPLSGVPLVGLVGLDLLKAMASTTPEAFATNDCLSTLLCLLDSSRPPASTASLYILHKIGESLIEKFPDAAAAILPRLGEVILAAEDAARVKHAVLCIGQFFKGVEGLDEQLEAIWAELLKNLHFDNEKLEATVVALGHLSTLGASIAASRLKPHIAKFFMGELMLKNREAESTLDTLKAPKSKKAWLPRREMQREARIRVEVVKMMTRYSLALIAADPKNQPSQPTLKTAFSTMRLLGRILETEGNLSSSASTTKVEAAHLRLVAANAFLKLANFAAHRKIADLITNEWFILCALVINDPKQEVRQLFAKKLHRKLLNFDLPLPYMAVFCLAANDPNKDNKVKARKFLVDNINQRRDSLQIMQNDGKLTNRVLPFLLPEYVLPYAIHLLAHDTDLSSHSNVPALRNIRECLWFLLEPLVKHAAYSYDFFRKMIEDLKRCKDASTPTDEEANLKLYAVCDLAMNLLMNKRQASNVRAGSEASWLAGGNPLIPKKIFVGYDPAFNNSTVYLPPELTGGTKVAGRSGGGGWSGGAAGSARPSDVIRTTATLIIRQADEDDEVDVFDDDDDDDETRNVADDDETRNVADDDDDERDDDNSVHTSLEAHLSSPAPSTSSAAQTPPCNASSQEVLFDSEEDAPLAKRLKISG